MILQRKKKQTNFVHEKFTVKIFIPKMNWALFIYRHEVVYACCFLYSKIELETMSRCIGIPVNAAQ